MLKMFWKQPWERQTPMDLWSDETLGIEEGSGVGRGVGVWGGWLGPPQDRRAEPSPSSSFPWHMRVKRAAEGLWGSARLGDGDLPIPSTPPVPASQPPCHDHSHGAQPHATNWAVCDMGTDE